MNKGALKKLSVSQTENNNFPVAIADYRGLQFNGFNYEPESLNIALVNYTETHVSAQIIVKTFTGALNDPLVSVVGTITDLAVRDVLKLIGMVKLNRSALKDEMLSGPEQMFSVSPILVGDIHPISKQFKTKTVNGFILVSSSSEY